MHYKLISVLTTFMLILPGLISAYAQEDVEGAEDHPMISRYEGSYIEAYERADYDRLVFPAEMEDGELQTIAPEGETTKILYVAPENLSVLQVVRNYQAALKNAGFEIVLEGFGGVDDLPCRSIYTQHSPDFGLRGRSPMAGRNASYFLARLPGAEGDVFVSGHTVNSDRYDGRVTTALQIVEEKPLQTGMVQVDISSEAMARDLKEAGRVMIYGIHFDTDEATIQEESAPTLSDIAGLLEQQSDLELGVVGHTDATGAVDYNMDLSTRRAEAVVDYLVSNHGIDPGRLTAKGLGPWSPVASNEYEDGRARNRRVELIRSPE